LRETSGRINHASTFYLLKWKLRCCKRLLSLCCPTSSFSPEGSETITVRQISKYTSHPAQQNYLPFYFLAPGLSSSMHILRSYSTTCKVSSISVHQLRRSCRDKKNINVNSLKQLCSCFNHWYDTDD